MYLGPFLSLLLHLAAAAIIGEQFWARRGCEIGVLVEFELLYTGYRIDEWVTRVVLGFDGVGGCAILSVTHQKHHVSF